MTEIPHAQGESKADERAVDEFACQRCGGCCRGEGYVWLTSEDIDRLCDFLQLDRREFLRRYTRRVSWNGDRALIDQHDDAQSCIFLQADRCRVHPVKPIQCVGFPSVWSRGDADDFCEGLKRLRQSRKRQ